MTKRISRRSLLQFGGAAGLAGVLTPSVAAASNISSPKIVNKYVRLGRTELRVSDVSFGSFALKTGEEGIVRHALDAGINYFDTAESYTKGQAEQVIGNALKGVRDQVYIATKTVAASHADAATLMRALEGSLTRLQTDYVDVYFNHAVNSVERLKNPGWGEFTERALEQGKIRFTGMSGHGGYLIDCVDYAVENDLADVMLLSQNFGQDPSFLEGMFKAFDFIAKVPGLPDAVARAKKRDIGVMGMKILHGAKLNDMRPFETDDGTFAQAAIKWALSMDTVDGAVITMSNNDRVNEYVGASGGLVVTDYDRKLLEQYVQINDQSYCRPACNDCTSACPAGVSIPDVLRMRMYAVNYGEPEIARTEYGRLEDNASPCLSCDGSPCANACTYGLNIARLCGPTHQMLT